MGGKLDKWGGLGGQLDKSSSPDNTQVDKSKNMILEFLMGWPVQFAMADVMTTLFARVLTRSGVFI